MLRKRISNLAIFIVFLLSACSTKNISTPSSIDPLNSLQSETVETSTPEPVLATSAPEPSETPTSESIPTTKPVATFSDLPATPTAGIATEPTCINRATLVRHLSFADDSKIQTGLFFNKIWRIQNSGSCTWTSAYKFVFDSGERMEAPGESPLPRDVPPGDTIDIQIIMRSPDVANTYIGNWMLRDPNGLLFGIGENGDQPIAIKIVVKYIVTKDKKAAPECG